jgi:hypothetical protein
MQRRELLRLLGSASLIAGLAPDDLLAFGRQTHAVLARDPAGPGFFDMHQLHTVAAAGDRIIPDTETPGAMVAECQRFTELIVADHYDVQRQQRFLDGLVNLDQRASRAHQRLFIDCGAGDMDGILSAVEADAYLASDDGGDSFWHDLKYLTIYGYYTSEIGMREELRVPVIPGHFDGCVPIGETRG